TLKQQWNFTDPRADLANCELCANDIFRDSWKETGVGHRAFQPPTFKRGDDTVAAKSCGCGNAAAAQSSVDVSQEALIQAITNRVLEALGK
ncbi:MAG: hypothetical protein ACRC2T_16245, partial [Thermoguttaceae bacterium]